MPGEYTTFQPYWYSLDVILPIIDLQQEKDWGPYIDTPPKHFVSNERERLFASIEYLIDPSTWTLRFCTRLLIWLQTLYGWVSSIVFVAMFTGLARKERDD